MSQPDCSPGRRFAPSTAMALLLGAVGAGCGGASVTEAPPETLRVVVTRTEFVRPQPAARPDAESRSIDLRSTLAPSTPAEERSQGRELTLLISEKTFATERGSLRVHFDDLDLLKVLNAEPVPIDVAESLPAWLQGLHGQTVRLRGWMYPTQLESGLEGFLFVRDNEICCFGRDAKVYDKIGVRLKPGTTTRYIQGRPFDVKGRFAIRPYASRAGTLDLLYQIVDAEVVER